MVFAVDEVPFCRNRPTIAATGRYKNARPYSVKLVSPRHRGQADHGQQRANGGDEEHTGQT